MNRRFERRTHVTPRGTARDVRERRHQIDSPCVASHPATDRHVTPVENDGQTKSVGRQCDDPVAKRHVGAQTGRIRGKGHMHALLTSRPQPERLRGTEAAEPPAKANGGQTLEVSVRERIVTLPHAPDDTGAHACRQLRAGEAACQQVSPRGDATKLIDGVQETSHSTIVRLQGSWIGVPRTSVDNPRNRAHVEASSRGRIQERLPDASGGDAQISGGVGTMSPMKQAFRTSCIESPQVVPEFCSRLAWPVPEF